MVLPGKPLRSRRAPAMMRRCNPTRRLHRPHDFTALSLRRRSRRHPVRLGRGPGHPRSVRAPHTRENRRHPQRPMSVPHLANWLFLLPASLLGATIAGGRCLASLSVSLLFRLRRGSPKRSGGGRVMRKAPCREDGWLTKQGFEIVAHRAHLAGRPCAVVAGR